MVITCQQQQSLVGGQLAVDLMNCNALRYAVKQSGLVFAKLILSAVSLLPTLINQIYQTATSQKWLN